MGRLRPLTQRSSDQTFRPDRVIFFLHLVPFPGTLGAISLPLMDKPAVLTPGAASILELAAQPGIFQAQNSKTCLKTKTWVLQPASTNLQLVVLLIHAESAIFPYFSYPQTLPAAALPEAAPLEKTKTKQWFQPFEFLDSYDSSSKVQPAST